MGSKLMRTIIVTSLLTAVAGTGVAMLTPRLFNQRQTDSKVKIHPALYNGPSNPSAYSQPAVQPRVRRASYSPRYADDSRPRDAYGEPIVRDHRSTEKSALIVAGSAGTGAAI